MKTVYFIVIMLFFPLTVLAGNYPLEIPKNFEHAPTKFVCERETPTVIYKRVYIGSDESGEWEINIQGRDKKDLFLTLMRSKPTNYGKHVKLALWIQTTAGWKRERDLTEQEKEWAYNEDHKFFLNNGEEYNFLLQCMQRARQAE